MPDISISRPESESVPGVAPTATKGAMIMTVISFPLARINVAGVSDQAFGRRLRIIRDPLQMSESQAAADLDIL